MQKEPISITHILAYPWRVYKRLVFVVTLLLCVIVGGVIIVLTGNVDGLEVLCDRVVEPLASWAGVEGF